MAASKQPIEAPITPAGGHADSLAGVEPATSVAGKNSQETPQDSCELGSFEPSLTKAEQKAAVDEFLKLDAEVYTKADELAGEYQALMQRFDDELLPRCDRVQAVLSQRGPMHIPGLPSWSAWRDAFIAFLQKTMKMSLSTFKRRLKEFQNGEPAEITAGEAGEEPADDTGTDDDPAPVVYESPKEQVTKWVEKQRKVLAGEIGPIDADPIRGGERRIDTAVLMLDEFQLALDEGLLDPVPLVKELNRFTKHYPTFHAPLKPVPLDLRQANELVVKWHRHHKPIRVAKFSIGVEKDGELVGVAICMRPACRALDDGRTIEVARLAVIEDKEDTEKAKNVCSYLYGSCARIAKEMGFSRIQTYILDREKGISLKGAGWTLEKRGCGGTAQGLRKNRPNGHEITPVTFKKKQRWAKQFDDKKPVSSVPVEVAEESSFSEERKPVTPTDVSQKKPVVALRVLQSPAPCGGCKDMHLGIAEMAKANPGMNDEDLAANSGCNVTTVRQARARYLDWNRETAYWRPILSPLMRPVWAGSRCTH